MDDSFSGGRYDKHGRLEGLEAEAHLGLACKYVPK